jgi:hypothetical protein
VPRGRWLRAGRGAPAGNEKAAHEVDGRDALPNGVRPSGKYGVPGLDHQDIVAVAAGGVNSQPSIRNGA